MKKVLFMLLTLVIATIYGQEDGCHILKNPDYPELERNLYRSTVQSVTNLTEKYVLNVKFHFVTDGIATSTNSLLGIEQAMNAIMILNTNFNQFNVFFKYKGFDYISNAQFLNINSQANNSNVNPTDPTFTALVNYSKTGMQNPVYDYNAMNLFIVDKIDKHTTTGAAQVAGVAYLQGVDSAYTLSRFLTSTLPHEIAHNFNVLHTWENSGSWTFVNNALTWIPNQNGERVDGLNWASAGDFIEDTPASHQLNPSGINHVLNPCQYVNPTQIADANGVIYNNVPYKNFMSTSNGCRQIAQTTMLPGIAEFTPKQGNYMRNQLAAYINSPTNIYGYANAKTTVQSLYQPFESIPSLGSIISITDDGVTNGMSTVCRYLGGYTYKYQKGFNYTFNRYGEITNNQLNELPSYRDDGTFMISQLDNNYQHEFGFMCWRGSQYCQLELIAGATIRTTKNLGNQQLTETFLSPLEIENPNLIQNLPMQTYSIIEKTTATGETKSETIYKP